MRPGAWSRIEVVLCDLDGVVWLAREPIPGAVEAVERLRASGRRVLFVTNNSVSVVAEQEAALEAIGIGAVDDVVTSAQAAASLVEPRERVLVCGGPGVREAVEARGAIALDIDTPTTSTPDVVVVGLDRAFTFDRLHAASAAVRDGARFVATNDDATFPTPAGETPGGGSIVAAVATAAGLSPVVAGKPHGAMARLVAERCGRAFRPDGVLMVGDRWSTDGAFALEIGCRFALVRSGVLAPGVEAPGPAALDVADLAAVAVALTESGRSGGR